MKTYKVLEAHQGDKAYKPGDQRIADENTVAHLVALGLLEEIGEAPNEPQPRSAVDDATAQIEALTGERDDARAELGTLRELQRGSEGDVAKLKGELAEATSALDVMKRERDEARDALAAKSAEAPRSSTRQRGGN